MKFMLDVSEFEVQVYKNNSWETLIHTYYFEDAKEYIESSREEYPLGEYKFRLMAKIYGV